MITFVAKPGNGPPSVWVSPQGLSCVGTLSFLSRLTFWLTDCSARSNEIRFLFAQCKCFPELEEGTVEHAAPSGTLGGGGNPQLWSLRLQLAPFT